jgi:hypothetical protein
MIKYEELIKNIYAAIDELYVQTSDQYMMWARMIAQRELSRKNNGLPQREKTGYDLRIELNGASFFIYWREVRFVKNGTKLIRLTKNLAVPRNYIYDKSKFKNASDWELDLIMLAEEYFSVTRKQLNHLMKAHTSILFAAKSSGTKITSTPIKNRVRQINVSVQSMKQKLS